MAEIGIKDLKATTSAVIERVEAGTAYVVTKRGRRATALGNNVSRAGLDAFDYGRGRCLEILDAYLSHLPVPS